MQRDLFSLKKVFSTVLGMLGLLDHCALLHGKMIDSLPVLMKAPESGLFGPRISVCWSARCTCPF
jgi:hypothetical protein